MAEALTSLVTLLVIRDIEEDATGAALRFEGGTEGRLVVQDPGYARSLKLARRSRERSQPVGGNFGERHAITEVLRADNGVPLQVSDLGSEARLVLFQGQDGVFRLRPDHPQAERLRGVLEEAIRGRKPVWFVAHRPDLVLLDTMPAGGQ